MDDTPPQAGTSAHDLRALEALDLPKLRAFAKDLIHENRRLRLIQKTVAKAGLGTGAVIELYSNERVGARYFGFVLCRADRDEVAFCADVREAIDRHLGPVLYAMNQKLLGTSAVDRKQPETAEDRAELAKAIYEALVESGEIEHSLQACANADFCVLYGYGAHLDALVSNVVEVANVYTAFAVRRSYLASRLEDLGRKGDAELVRRALPADREKGPSARLLVCELGGDMEVQWKDAPEAEGTTHPRTEGALDAQVKAALDALAAKPRYLREHLWDDSKDACVVFGLVPHLRALWPWVGGGSEEYDGLVRPHDDVNHLLAALGRAEDAARVHSGPTTSQPEGARLLVIVTESAVSVFWWSGTEVLGQ